MSAISRLPSRLPSTSPGGEAITDADFRAIAALAHQVAGIVLNANKRELVSSRLGRRVRNLGLSSFAEYRALVEGPDGADERGEMINALTTNLTSFFREKHHFDYLADTVLPWLLKSRPGRLRIWSAACSSGEEPYSIAMVLKRALGSGQGWDAKILATDIDSNMVAQAQAGSYERERAASIPARYAGGRTQQSGGQTIMPDELKRLITFKQLNLLGPWPMRGPFDVIFCRNVVIYFDKETQRELFDRMADILTPDGTLFIGHSETLFRVSDRFEPLGRTIYRRLR
jgi:chemotaxis protein methyltransferase CheR